jgi:hypothetical protein
MVSKSGLLMTMVIRATVAALILAYSVPTQPAGAFGKHGGTSGPASTNIGSDKIRMPTSESKMFHDMAPSGAQTNVQQGTKIKGKMLDAGADIFGKRGVGQPAGDQTSTSTPRGSARHPTEGTSRDDPTVSNSGRNSAPGSDSALDQANVFGPPDIVSGWSPRGGWWDGCWYDKYGRPYDCGAPWPPGNTASMPPGDPTKPWLDLGLSRALGKNVHDGMAMISPPYYAPRNPYTTAQGIWWDGCLYDSNGMPIVCLDTTLPSPDGYPTWAPPNGTIVWCPDNLECNPQGSATVIHVP